MSLSITINNINDLTDAERAVLRYMLDGVPISDELRERRVPPADGGVSDTKKYLELIGHTPVPPAAPAASAASIPTPPGPPVPASAELDSDGLPWDKRIHSSSRNKLQDGTWRKLKGVDKDLVATVEAELRAVQAIPVPVVGATGTASVGTTDGIVTEVTASVPVPPAPTTTLAEMQAALAAAEELPQHPVPVPPAPLTFADLMRKHVTPRLLDGKLTQDTLIAVAGEFGLPHLAALGARPDLVEAVRARIDEVCNAAA